MFGSLRALCLSTVLVAAVAQAEPTEGEMARLAELAEYADGTDPTADSAANRAAWQAALDYAATLYPSDHPRLASIESQLSLADYFDSDVPGAIARLERLTPILIAAGPDYMGDVIDNQNALAVFYAQSGKHEEARLMAEAVLAQRREQFAAAPESKTAIKELGAALNNLANAENEIGNYDRAVELSRESTHYADMMEGTLPNAAVWYANYPLFLERAGRLDEALTAARDTIRIIEKLLPEGHPFRSDILNTFASMASDRGLFAEAEDAGSLAIAISTETLGADNYKTAGYKTLLSQVYLRTGRPTEALDLIEQAIPPLDANFGSDGDLVLLSKQIRAASLFHLGRTEAAYNAAREVWEQRNRINHPGHRDRIAAGELLAEIEFARGDPAAAHATYQDIQAARRDILPDGNLELLSGEVELAYLAAVGGAGDYASALDAADHLWATASRQSAIDPLARREFSAVTNALATAAEAAMATGDDERTFVAAQRVLRTSADDAVSSAGLRRGLSPDERHALREEQDRSRENVRLNQAYMQAVSRAADPAILEGLEARLAALGSASSAALGASNALPRLPSLDDVQAGLEAKQAVLVAVPLPRSLLTMAIRADRTVIQRVTATSAEVGGAVSALRNAMGVGFSQARGVLPTRQQRDVYDFAPGAELHALIFTPEIDAALEGTENLAIAAGGTLSRIPFSVLAPRPATGRLADADWLIRHHSLSTLASLSSLTQSERADGTHAARVVAVGAPVLGGAALSTLRSSRMLAPGATVADLPPLPEALAELNALSRALDTADTVLLTGEDAREASVLAAISQPADVIAFATHGLLEGDLAGLAEPALVLTPNDGEDGLLTASEIAALDMDADWVVLSACNTGGPDRPGAAGLSGLASAFLYAGARNLLVSHWEVADDVARAITVPTVESYYREGIAPAEGLRRAVLALIENSNEARLQHPAYWAPFVYVGS